QPTFPAFSVSAVVPKWFTATIWPSAPNRPAKRLSAIRHDPKKREPRPLVAAGAQRRVIEGEGLGGFARRHTVNAWSVNRFPAAPRFFCSGLRCGSEIFWCWPAAGRLLRAAQAGSKSRPEH